MANTRENRLTRLRKDLANEQKQVDRLEAELNDPTMDEKKRANKVLELAQKTKRRDHKKAQLDNVEAKDEPPVAVKDDPTDAGA